LTPLGAIFLVLLVLWALFLFGGFIFGKLDAAKTRRMPPWTRMASSLTLVILAWITVLFARPAEASRYTWLIALGMSLGFVGDLFMAHLIRIKQPEMGGIAAFGLGHIAYILAFWKIGNKLYLTQAGVREAALAVWLLIGLAGWYIAVFRGQKPSALNFAALPYALLLSTTTGFATALAVQNSSFIPLAIGCTLFLLSDLIVAAHLFRGAHFYLIDDVVWLTYGPAQMLIVSMSVFVTGWYLFGH
jgi:YhhN-like protein